MSAKKQVSLLALIFALLGALAACSIEPGPSPIDGNWPYDQGDSNYNEFTGNNSFEGSYQNYSVSRHLSFQHNGWNSGFMAIDLSGYGGSVNVVVRDPQGRIIYAASDLLSTSLGVPMTVNGTYPVELELKRFSGGIDIRAD